MTWAPQVQPPRRSPPWAGTYCLRLLHPSSSGSLRGQRLLATGDWTRWGGWPKAPSSPGARSRTMPGVLHGLVQKVLSATLCWSRKLLGAGGLQGGRGRGLARQSSTRHHLPAAHGGPPQPHAHLAPSLGKAPKTCPGPQPTSPHPSLPTLVSHLPSPATRPRPGRQAQVSPIPTELVLRTGPGLSRQGHPGPAPTSGLRPSCPGKLLHLDVDFMDDGALLHLSPGESPAALPLHGLTCHRRRVTAPTVRHRTL